MYTEHCSCIITKDGKITIRNKRTAGVLLKSFRTISVISRIAIVYLQYKTLTGLAFTTTV